MALSVKNKGEELVIGMGKVRNVIGIFQGIFE